MNNVEILRCALNLTNEFFAVNDSQSSYPNNI
ncbi:Uncharacterised protein [Vibrio cholerae]|nr:Uncharacterised protein [Vibrio cholerae]